MTIALYYIAFIVIVMISGLSVRWFNFADKGIIKFLLPFSGAYLLGVSFFHLVPEVFRSDLPQPGVFILLGYLIQIGLDYFSKGIEHGHVHVNKASNQFPWAVFLSLCLHSLFEGMPAIEHHHGHDHGHHHHHDHEHGHSHGIYKHIGHPHGPRTMIDEGFCCCFMSQFPQDVIDEERELRLKQSEQK